MTVDDKLEGWQFYYQKLLNVEFPGNAANMSEEAPVEGTAITITPEMVFKAMSKMKSRKAAGPSNIIEMIKTAGDGVVVCLTSLFNHII